jgi:hypothetical protein
MTNETVRWQFPRIEGVVVRNETGEWSDTAFHNELLNGDDQSPVVWHQAAPEDDVADIAAWERWKNYLETGRDVGEALRLRALSEVGAKIRILRQRGGQCE